MTGTSIKAGFRVQGSGYRVQGSGFRVQGTGYRGKKFPVDGLQLSAKQKVRAYQLM
jgi:hypothetical protein